MKPQKGAALFFLNLLPSGNPDPSSHFLECPMVRGERWVAEKALAAIKYTDRVDPNECVDNEERCEEWARDGECTANPTYMVGKPTDPGNCRKACRVCTPQLEAPTLT